MQWLSSAGMALYHPMTKVRQKCDLEQPVPCCNSLEANLFSPRVNSDHSILDWFPQYLLKVIQRITCFFLKKSHEMFSGTTAYYFKAGLFYL